MYRYGLLKPQAAPVAAVHNMSLLGPLTLGIEVTEPALAAKCGLGNVDPQHTGQVEGLSAIEACLLMDAPPHGATFVTLRPDVDAFGSMALMTLRARDTELGATTLERVREIGEHDRFARGPWPGPGRISECRAGEGQFSVHPLAVLTFGIRQRGLGVKDRVLLMQDWLASGTIPKAHEQQVKTRQQAIRRGLQNGSISVKRAAAGPIAVVQSRLDDTLFLGYGIAPITIALNPEFVSPDGTRYRKLTVAQYAVGYVDLASVLAGLREREPGWGGSATIIGSTQGASSILDLAHVVDVVGRHVTQTGRSIGDTAEGCN